MTPFLFRLLACAVLLVVPANLTADDKIELRWNFKKDQVRKYLLKHREVRTVVFADQKFVTTTDAEYEWQWTIKEVDDQGAASIEKKLTALRVTASGKEYDFQYDSARGNESTDHYKKKLIHFYDQLRFSTYRMKIRADGAIDEVYGFDKLQGELRDSLTVNGLNVLDFDGLNLRDESIRWYLQMLLGRFPGEAVPARSSWKQPMKQKLTGIGELTGEAAYATGPTVKAPPTSKVALPITVGGEQSLELSMKWVGDNTLVGTLKTTKFNGTIYLDAELKKFDLLGSNITMNLAGELKLGTQEKAPTLKATFEHELKLERKP